MSNNFIIKDVNFKDSNYGIEDYLNNWPMLYILENGSKAYVGQTNCITKRMNQHKESDSKQLFTKAHFIYFDKSNQSATFDYESRLISLMVADNKFILTNLNAGLSGVQYYNKDFYDSAFRDLWEQLRTKNLADKTIEELEQSDLFKYSPYKQLSTDQRNLVTEISENLSRSLNRKIVINGMPGSGKTILAIYLFKFLRMSPNFVNLKLGFVVPPTSLRTTIKKVFKSINGLSEKDVIGPNDIAKQKYDIVLVDEAHRLKMRKNLSSYSFYDQACKQIGLDTDATQLDWILKQSKCAIIFYDKKQIVYPQGLRIDALINHDFTDNRSTSFYTLTSQMRCLGGITYLEDIDKLLNNRLTSKVRTDGYELFIVKDFNDFEKILSEKESKCKLSRMIAGYAWEWKSKNDNKKFDISLDGRSRQWNSTLDNWVNSKNAINEVGCIHSIQGYDLNYGFVIIGNDLKYNPKEKKIYIDRNSYYDKYGKNNTTDEELEEYIKNIYYVLLTRGIKGTYLYICDENLRNYMSQFIETYSNQNSSVLYSRDSNYGILQAAEKSPSYGK